MGGTPKGKKPRTPRRVASDSEPSDGNAPPAAALDSEQRMSKEKQKFFRFSAFNMVKRRRDSSSDCDGARQRLGREQRRRARRARPASPPAPAPAPLAPLAPRAPTIFERLARDTAVGVWGFAAEAQKQLERPAPECPPEAARPQSRVARRRSRCGGGERLLTTLFDGLSEFYSVRSASRARSVRRARPRDAPDGDASDARDAPDAPDARPARRERSRAADDDRQVLKETRSTFRRYQASLRREPGSPRGPSPAPALSASQLVRCLAAGKRRAEPADPDKLYRGLALARRDRASPANNQTGKAPYARDPRGPSRPRPPELDAAHGRPATSSRRLSIVAYFVDDEKRAVEVIE